MSNNLSTLFAAIFLCATLAFSIDRFAEALEQSSYYENLGSCSEETITVPLEQHNASKP